MFLAVALTTLLAADSARFSLELDGAAVSVIDLERDGKTYRYRSTPLFGAAARSDEFTALTPVPEGLWLWKKPRFGCVDGIEELTRRVGRLCVDESKPDRVKGTVFGGRFEARYDTEGLVELKIGGSRFVRGPSTLPARNPFVSGFAITGDTGPIEIEPSLVDSRRPSNAPTPLATSLQPGRCLELATQYVRDHPGAEVVLGLVREGDRAFPHAWVRGADGTAIDPSAVGEKTRADDYLELPRAHAGTLYVELLTGERMVRRSKR